jgi:hypothetical protein
MDFIKLKLAELREIYPNDRLKISIEHNEGGDVADGGKMANGGLTNIKGNAPVMKYPEIKSEVTIVE